MNYLNYNNILKIFQFKFVRSGPSTTIAESDATKDGNFKLLRYFSLSSLTFFLIAITVLNHCYRRSALGDLIVMGERENATLAKSLSNSLWPDLNPYLNESEGLSAKQLRDRQQISVLQSAIEEQTRGLSIVKVKVYNLEGQTIFSTDKQQIGQDKSQSDGFLSAVTGKVRTQLDHRDTFTAIRGEIEDRDLLASYVPIQSNNSSQEIKGVFELYSDVTPIVQKIQKTQISLTLNVTLTLAMLYLILFLIVRRADRLIKSQYLALQQSETQYQQKAVKLKETLEELQKTQFQLIHQEKMAALGQLVAGIAHEINTPLGAIQASAGNTSKALIESIEQLPKLNQYLDGEEQECFFQLIDRTMDSNPLISSAERRSLKRQLTKQLKEQGIENPRKIADILMDLGLNTEISLFIPLIKHAQADWILHLAYNLTRLITNNRNIQKAVERASKVVFALKNYTRQEISSEKQLVSVTDGIETVLQIYHNQIKRDIELIQDYQSQSEIWCYPDELMQVWTNLIYNAIQAMGQKGTLTIATAQQEDQVKVEISDSGCGILPEVQTKIFAPFYTTKPAGEGSGLGLHISNKIIDKHQGTIEVKSQPGKTTFTVWLPIKNK